MGNLYRNVLRQRYNVQWDDKCLQQSDRRSEERGTSSGITNDSKSDQHCEVLGFCCKGSKNPVQYNDTRDANECATYCVIHQLFPIETLRVMSASDSTHVVPRPPAITYTALKILPRLPWQSRVHATNESMSRIYRPAALFDVLYVVENVNADKVRCN
jgi:hypothetical protein